MSDWIFVDSTNIEAIRYDEPACELQVRFLRSGDIYAYYNVEKWRFDELMAADSKGTYLNRSIKPSYQCAKL
jgi:hypothetical protein